MRKQKPTDVPKKFAWGGAVENGLMFESLVSRLGDKPTLRELQCFQFTNTCWRQKRINIIEAIAPQWRELGSELKLTENQLFNIEHNVKEDRCRAVLESWFKGSKDQLTWSTLLQAMTDAGCTSVAQQVRRGKCVIQ